MKILTSSWAACVLALSAFGAPACGGNALDGGSSKTDGGPGASSGSSGGDSTIPATALAGTVNGATFAPKSIEVQREGGRWFFTVRSYEYKCGASSSPLTGAALALITIGDVATHAGTESISEADGHGATFQAGVFEQGKGEPILHTVTSGSLRFDTWSDVPGATMTGGLKLLGEGSSVAGTFTATVCPPRG